MRALHHDNAGAMAVPPEPTGRGSNAPGGRLKAIIPPRTEAEQTMPPADRDLLTLSAHGLRQVAAVLSGQQVRPDVERVWEGRLASAQIRHSTAA